MRKVDEHATTMLAEICNDYQRVFEQAPNLALQVEERLKNWADKTNRHCLLEYPYYDAQNELNAFTNLNFDSLFFKKYELALNKYKALCLKSSVNYNKDFWDTDLVHLKNQADASKSKNVKAASDLATSANLLAKEWQKLLCSLYEQWELEQITLLREKFLKSLVKKLKLIDEMLTLLCSLGLEPGILLDLSSGSLKLNNLAKVKSLMERIHSDEGIKKLLDLLGRINQVKKVQE